MSKIDSILAVMNEVVSNPAQSVKKYKQATGKLAVGCFPPYTPGEIVHAAGMLPVGLWGGETQASEVHTYLPAFACSIMQSIMEFSLKGVYDDLSVVIIPSHCDTLKCVGQNWKTANPEIIPIYLVHPQNTKLPAGVKYLSTEYGKIRRALEDIGGYVISDEALNDSIALFNKHRQLMREFTKLSAQYPHIISPSKRHLVIKSSYFMDKAEHIVLVDEIINELKKEEIVPWKGKKIVLTGIMAEPTELLDIFTEYQFAVVGDDLAHESRQFRSDTPEGLELPLVRLAKQYANMEGCSLIYDPKKKRGSMLVDLVKETDADGVVVCMMKFCDPEEFDYPIYKKQLDNAGIPVLYLEVDQQTPSVEQARTRIQGFSEMLKAL